MASSVVNKVEHVVPISAVKNAVGGDDSSDEEEKRKKAEADRIERERLMKI